MIGAARIRAEPAEARRMLRKTAGLPQVVQVLGARLASRPGWSLATATERLSNRGPEQKLRHAECSVISTHTSRR
jgi:hypothetical protein